MAADNQGTSSVWLFAPSSSSARRDGIAPLTQEQIEYQEYWSAFRDALTARGAQHWTGLSLPRSTWYGKNVGRPGFNFYVAIRPKRAHARSHAGDCDGRT